MIGEKGMDNSKAHHAPLHPKDTPTQTYGCRQSNPDNCARNSQEGVCAFVRSDSICLYPPKSWPKLYKKLQEFIQEKTGSKVEKKNTTKKPAKRTKTISPKKKPQKKTSKKKPKKSAQKK